MTDLRFANVLSDDYELFERLMPQYAELQDKIEMAVREHTARSRTKSITVVEGGTGTGFTSKRVLDADPRIQLIGIDYEKRMLRQARKNLNIYKKRITLRHDDLISALQKMTATSADIFVSGHTIHNMTPANRRRVFKEIARVLRQGGLFIAVDKYARDNVQLHRKDFQRRLKEFRLFDTVGRSDLREKWTKHNQEDEKIKFTEKEQKTLLQRYTFSKIKRIDRCGMDAIIAAIR